ncbi:hypothetical protein [Flavobacterium sp. ACAM 123]|jgi:hypothetical protein|uniref:hypothetical protein n=1 Tax=Flavobacterium sp. ACAM 123 TaxID=1189620 RepID=UPI00035D5A6B|nr:hypothetical protein [Flavobacterium sp. ACAM 123]
MKNILFIFIVLLFSRCTEQGEDRKYNYTITNNSGVIIEMIPYFSGKKDVKYKITINNDEKFNKVYTDQPPYTGGLVMDAILFSGSNQNNLTHIEITFNNYKKIIYQGCTETNQCFNQPRNIFNPIFSDERTETYIISLEDYQNAIDCGGNCN